MPCLFHSSQTVREPDSFHRQGSPNQLFASVWALRTEDPCAWHSGVSVTATQVTSLDWAPLPSLYHKLACEMECPELTEPFKGHSYCARFWWGGCPAVTQRRDSWPPEHSCAVAIAETRASSALSHTHPPQRSISPSAEGCPLPQLRHTQFQVNVKAITVCTVRQARGFLWRVGVCA